MTTRLFSNRLEQFHLRPIIAAAALTFGLHITPCLADTGPLHHPTHPMPHDLTIAEIEKAHTYPDDGRVPHVPFGFENAKWISFKSQMRPGDKIVDFASAPESWHNLAGRAGYALVRNGKVIAQFVTMMN